MERSSGIVLGITSLPGKYGIGSLGQTAYVFADYLASAGQRVWQLLPLGPTSYGDSPYQSFSSFAGNPYLIDPDMLAADGLLTEEELAEARYAGDPRLVDYGWLWETRWTLLAKAAARGLERDREACLRFARGNERWLEPYALFMAAKRGFGMKPWWEWPKAYQAGDRESTRELIRKEFGRDAEFFTWLQFTFFRQWEALRGYVHEKGLKLMGDLPIYVAADSADVWSEPHFFDLGEDNLPVEVAGVPPDYFSKTGQLWGNPLYRWDRMEEDGYGWWIRRIDGAGRLYDIIRIDHFRGFDSYWSVPYGAKNAVSGHWNKGPGMKLIGVLSSWFPELSFVAEDLGIPSPGVKKLLQDSGWPGMRVLEFAFVPGADSPYLPHNIRENSICYTGTHDNLPIREWAEENPEEAAFAALYLSQGPEEPASRALIRAGMGSVSALFAATMQDVLDLGKGHAMNRPGTSAGNWRWRMLDDELSPELAASLRELTERYGRCPRKKKAEADEEAEEGASADADEDLR